MRGDTNAASDVFVHDRQQGTHPAGERRAGRRAGNDNSFIGAISADGRFVAFSSFATNLVPDDTNSTEDVFVRVLRSGG